MSRTTEQRRIAVQPALGAQERGVAPVAERRRNKAASDRATPSAEVRCRCGSLMARLIGNRIELKCRRCKRVVVVATDRASRGWVAVPGNGCGP